MAVCGNDLARELVPCHRSARMRFAALSTFASTKFNPHKGRMFFQTAAHDFDRYVAGHVARQGRLIRAGVPNSTVTHSSDFRTAIG